MWHLDDVVRFERVRGNPLRHFLVPRIAAPGNLGKAARSRKCSYASRLCNRAIGRHFARSRMLKLPLRMPRFVVRDGYVAPTEGAADQLYMWSVARGRRSDRSSDARVAQGQL